MRKYRYKPKKYKRIQRIKKKKSIFKRWSFWLILLFAIIFGAGFYFFIFSSAFQIKEIKISGNMKVPVEKLKKSISQEVDKKLLFFNLKNIFLANLKEMDDIILREFPQIARVTLEREFPDVLAAQVEERKSVAVFCGQERYFFIDKEGIIFEEIDESNLKMLKIKLTSATSLGLGETVIEKEKIDSILKIESKSTILFEEVLIVSESRFNAKTTEGWEVYFNPKRDLDWQLTKLNILLKEKIPPEKRGNLEYIDLRFEKIYIFPENY